MEKYSRKEKNIGELFRRFVMLYIDNRTPEVNLDGAASHLGVERRKMYDIVNILESFEVVSRRAKNTYNWHGLHKIEETI